MVSKQDVENTFIYQSGSLLRRSTGKRGYKRPDGYVYTRIGGKSYGEHRLVFLMFNGFIPDQVDHINGCREDNRPENLRSATHAQNCMNRKPMASSPKGCYWQPKRGKWMVQVSVSGKRKTVGYFDTEKAASAAYAKAAEESYGEYARTK